MGVLLGLIGFIITIYFMVQVGRIASSLHNIKVVLGVIHNMIKSKGEEEK